MNCAIITVGDELLIGQVLDTNSSWLAAELTDHGVFVSEMQTVPDTTERISRAVQSALSANDLVVVTGGLGPTHDDVTRDGVAAAVGRELVYDEAIFERIKLRFERRGRVAPESNRSQAFVPQGFEAINNDMGSAPGLWFEFEEGSQHKALFAVPGVPREMKWLFDNHLVPRLKSRGIMNGQTYRTFSTTGIGESNFQDLIKPFLDRLPEDVSVAYLPNLDGVRLRIGVRDPAEAAVTKLDALENNLREVASGFIYSTSNQSLEEVVVKGLARKGLTVACAESCTGGMVASRLTDVAGASAVFVGGVVAYSNELKISQLGVDGQLIDTHGAVSSEVAAAMAAGVRSKTRADVGIATTGIMGPSGGTPEKPVGTVWFGIDSGDGPVTLKIVMGTDRLGNKRRTSTAALNLVRKRVLKL